MKEFWSFVLIYWKEILQVVCVISSVLCVIFRKSKLKLFDSPYEQVVSQIPSLINKAEWLYSRGSEKKQFVLNACINLLAEITHKSFEICSLYSVRFSRAIEDILSTPTKKGEKCEAKNEKVH